MSVTTATGVDEVVNTSPGPLQSPRTWEAEELNDQLESSWLSTHSTPPVSQPYTSFATRTIESSDSSFLREDQTSGAVALEPFNIRAAFPIEIRTYIFELLLARVDKEQALEAFHRDTHQILLALRPGCADADHLSVEYSNAVHERMTVYDDIRCSRIKTPGLLIALRSAPDLYTHALQIYYTINRFELRPHTQWNLSRVDLGVGALDNLSPTTLRTIRHLNVQIDEFEWDGMISPYPLPDGPNLLDDTDTDTYPVIPLPDHLQNFNLNRIVPQFINLQTLHTRVQVSSWSSCAVFLSMVRKLKKLTRVDFEVLTNCESCNNPRSPQHGHRDYTAILVEGMNVIWGVPAKLERVSTKYDEFYGHEFCMIRSTFFWQAPQGDALNWSWDSYRRALQPEMMATRYLGEICFDGESVWCPARFVADENEREWYNGPLMQMFPCWLVDRLLDEFAIMHDDQALEG